ncbi:MAG: carboxypeptidase regulatory-like domain-containing protein [Planctomycetes bacterium]|nr:carboxypeptidase regulatory-like domain-containing protein [Planctomycetota bacterium]
MRTPVVVCSLFALSVAAPSVGCQQPLRHDVTGEVIGADPAARHSPRLMLWHHDYRSEAATVVADSFARDDGAFAMKDVEWLAGNDWGFEFFVLFARQGDRVAMSYLRGDAAAREPLHLELKQAVTLRGRVADGAGHPVADAEVALYSLSHGAMWAWFAEAPPGFRVRSDADGRFKITGVPPGMNHGLTCLADGFARGRVDTADLDGIDFQLDPGGALVGRVVLASGAPAVRVRICAQGTQHSAWATTRTDDDGRYRLGSLPDDTYNVWAEAPELVGAALDRQGIELGEQVEAPPLKLTPGGLFVGKVVDATTGETLKPGPSADVAIYGPSRPRSGAACDCSPVAADGTFRIRVAPGSNYIYLRGVHGYASVGPDSFTLDVGEGEEQQVEFRVQQAPPR